MLSAANDLPELNDEVRELRMALSGQLAKLVNGAVTAYDEKRFAECEAAMERVLLVSPENETAKIYLPRARSRRKAMERLQ